MAITSETFPLWHSFPVEIQSLIMEQCPSNDLICLRLTCKKLYNLSPIRQHVSLSNADPSLETVPLCSHSPVYTPGHAHQQACHKIAHDHLQKLFEEGKGKEPRRTRGCRTNWRKEHCECFTSWGRRSKLAYRLREWVPRNLKYCKDCHLFTKRKASHKGKCYHGRPKPRTAKSNFWTHHSRRGAFGYRLWKKWVNNAAMNKYEKRLRVGQTKRVDRTRYGLRSLPKQDVDTSSSREYCVIVEEYE